MKLEKYRQEQLELDVPALPGTSPFDPHKVPALTLEKQKARDSSIAAATEKASARDAEAHAQVASESAIYQGDALHVLRTLPSCSVQCVVTSPPYWGLRDYNIPHQIGLEETLPEFIARLRAVFAEVRRVLREDGVFWLNIGDGYTSGNRGWRAPDRKNRARAMNVRPDTPAGMKPKDLMGIPWRLALALQDDGWFLRADIIWNKPNAMPESVKDRPTRAHEYLFMFSKSAKYFYDRQATLDPNGRNRRSVWTIATESSPNGHFACVDADTECLTAVGWKRHADLQPGVLAAQFDLVSGKLSWAPIADVARYGVTNQDMIVGSSRDMDMWLTPNHRTIIRRRHPRTRLMQEPVVVRAEELKASHSIPTAVPWSFEGDASTPVEWAELLGWYVSEGHESRDSLSIEIYQSEAANSSKCRRIEELLRLTGAEWSAATCKRQWRGRDAHLRAYRVFGYAAVRLREMAPGKRLPWRTVLWSDDRIEAVLHGLIGGDGHVRPDGRQSFVQKNLDQCGLVQALALRLGLSATVSVRKDGIGVVYLTKHKTRSFRGTSGVGSPPTVRKYTGVVWCPKLPKGTWMARRNGKPFITGNTFPPLLPETCIKASTRPGDVVLDPFLGSGTVGLVAAKLGRTHIGIELHPEYIALARQRLRSAGLV